MTPVPNRADSDDPASGDGTSFIDSSTILLPRDRAPTARRRLALAPAPTPHGRPRVPRGPPALLFS